MVDAIEKIFTNKIREEYEQKHDINIQINTSKLIFLKKLS
jgi:hypothetical protein